MNPCIRASCALASRIKNIFLGIHELDRPFPTQPRGREMTGIFHWCGFRARQSWGWLYERRLIGVPKKRYWVRDYSTSVRPETPASGQKQSYWDFKGFALGSCRGSPALPLNKYSMRMYFVLWSACFFQSRAMRWWARACVDQLAWFCKVVHTSSRPSVTVVAEIWSPLKRSSWLVGTAVFF